MATNKLSTEAIALTEKKMDMTLDDIIKMSKKPPFKGKQTLRSSNKSQGFPNDNVAQRNLRAQRFTNSRSAIRQGVLAQRRTNFKGNQFPVTTEAARRAAVMSTRIRAINTSKQRVAAAVPIRNNIVDGNFIGMNQAMFNKKQKPKTLDALFAGLKEQRLKSLPQQQSGRGRSQAGLRRGRLNQQRQGGRIGFAGYASAARYANNAR